MGLATINGVAVVKARFTMPRQGCWVGDVVSSDPVDPGPVTIKVDSGLTWVGTGARGGEWTGTGYLRVVPGANGLGVLARPKHYNNVSLGVVAKDLLGTAGEVLAASSDPKLLATQFTSYTVARDAVGRCLSALLQDRRLTDPVWRALADGTIWIGYETWPDAGLRAPDDYQDVNELPNQARAELGFDSPLLVPGVSLEGRRVSAVQHDMDGEQVRTTTWFED